MNKLLVLILVLLIPVCFAQLSPSERKILFRLQRLLEFPEVVNGWSNWTNFCYLPPSESVKVVCSNNHITELTIVGNKSSAYITPKPNQETFKVSKLTLSEYFSIDSFFTTLTKLSGLQVLSLVSLGLWGELPAKINRFDSLRVLNLSSNFIYRQVPGSIARLQSLQTLVLTDNMFIGDVPDLSSLSALEEFDVGGNYLGPKFPTLPNNLVTVILKQNEFRSGIPLELNNFNHLQHLDFSSNQILGMVPSSLFSLPSIEYINLAGNQFRGTVGTNISCSDGLKFVDLSHNYLFGDLPRCIKSNATNKVVMYSWNCLLVGDLNFQHPDSFCHEKALAVKPPLQGQSRRSTKNKSGIILGITGAVAGGIVVIGLLVLLVFRKARTMAEVENKTFEKSVVEKSFVKLTPSVFFSDARNVSSVMSFGALGLPPYHAFSLEEIEETTNEFDTSYLMGVGSQGQLYKGRLQDGSLAVVRCWKLKQRHSPQSILKHIEVMSKLRHRHLVSVLGHCVTTPHDYPNAANTIFVVSEYVSNGTLRSHLTEWRKRDTLKWPQRISITIGIARGIHFLHAGVTPGLVGNNLKIENILLDENLSAKISNYTLPIQYMADSESKFNGVETNGHVNAETSGRDDVYQLGVILLEVITGKPITSQSELDEQKIQLQRSLTESPTKITSFVDPSIRGTFAYESLRTAIEITINCLSKDSKQRPSVEDVLWNLQYSLQVQEGWSPSHDIHGI